MTNSPSLNIQDLLKISLAALNSQNNTNLSNGQSTYSLAERIEAWFREMAITESQPEKHDVLMRDALYAFNSLPNFKFENTDSYSLASALTKKIREYNLSNDVAQHPGLEHVHPETQQKHGFAP